MMSKIRSTGGKAEVMLGKMLWHQGIRYRRNYKKLPGKPDIAITKYKLAIFVDGEFWHGYNWKIQKEKRIHHNRSYWIPKIEKNIARDRKQEKELEKIGWEVIRFWEKHQVLKDPDFCVKIILNSINNKKAKKN
ncbi:DNA mismatch endonuclease Vsr [Liquorilactobacillus sucicola DSM 21376 = JCM 15457]|uniref:DNA mismatch endonuclease Vsr n=2 Tax=Liquorilactobacillus sucicola TaxID=519050 RepID=A0A0R2DMY9_9LACO|nr:DNA mismatch endonuclease Vsr [Liquorilactobacillus sucicola DSM 21376 = JCM 15457]